MCQSRTSLGSETDSGMSKEEIVELSKWKPKSKGKKILEREKKDQGELFISIT